jgi:hypothetical protein
MGCFLAIIPLRNKEKIIKAGSGKDLLLDISRILIRYKAQENTTIP